LVEAADRALYEAKISARYCVRLATSRMNAAAETEAGISARYRRLHS
jgi:hypothetical protein